MSNATAVKKVTVAKKSAPKPEVKAEVLPPKVLLSEKSDTLPDAMKSVLKVKANFEVKFSSRDQVLEVKANATQCDSFHQAVFISAETRKAVKAANFKDSVINWSRKDGLHCLFVPKSNFVVVKKEAPKKSKVNVKKVTV